MRLDRELLGELVAQQVRVLSGRLLEHLLPLAHDDAVLKEHLAGGEGGIEDAHLAVGPLAHGRVRLEEFGEEEGRLVAAARRVELWQPRLHTVCEPVSRNDCVEALLLQGVHGADSGLPHHRAGEHVVVGCAERRRVGWPRPGCLSEVAHDGRRRLCGLLVRSYQVSRHRVGRRRRPLPCPRSPARRVRGGLPGALRRRPLGYPGCARSCRGRRRLVRYAHAPERPQGVHEEGGVLGGVPGRRCSLGGGVGGGDGVRALGAVAHLAELLLGTQLLAEPAPHELALLVNDGEVMVPLL
mmetsp:Transcript_13316/g.39229  ORF Transcript_13316/g.39229 Transcript_13316/m.39229 type:complete len:297 (+) Transcript_13316:270-1160(+)